jgi:KRAB domain-containing zinc finger protein
MANELYCQKCNYKTKLSSKLYAHIHSVHGYACHICSFTSVKKQNLLRHIDINHIQKTLTCTECPFAGSNEDELFSHFQRDHSKIKHQCPYCEYYTIWRTNLRKHVIIRHKQYSCE